MQVPYFRRPIRAHAGGTSYTPAQLAAIYNFPKLTVSQDCTISIIELGGGYDPAMIAKQFQQWNLPAPKLADVSIEGGKNTPGGDADVEVILDIVVAAAVYSYMTGRPAVLRILFCPNSDAGFIEGAKEAAGMCSISWGSPEDQWALNSIQAMDTAFKANVGAHFFVASGDNGSSDGETGDHADYPGASPYAICCGGTTLTTANGKITNEVPWNAGGGATGGGYSVDEAAPPWQAGFVPAGKGRGVPDLCADADPQTGYQTPVGIIGGTSAVAPFIAGYFAALTAAGVKFTTPADLYRNEPCFHDIVEGNNGSQSATNGWDAASGLGSPDGTLIYNALRGATPPPPTPIPGPIPTPVPVPTPMPSGPTEVKVISTLDSAFSDLEKWNPGMYANVFRQINPFIDMRVSGLWTTAPHASTGVPVIADPPWFQRLWNVLAKQAGQIDWVKVEKALPEVVAFCQSGNHSEEAIMAFLIQVLNTVK